MTKENGYTEWRDHPRWGELCKLSDESVKLKTQAERLRKIISNDIFGTEPSSLKGESK